MRSIAANNSFGSAGLVLQSAEKDLRRGRIDEARATLESLVRAFPHASEAARARRLLDALGSALGAAPTQSALPEQVVGHFQVEAGMAAGREIRLPPDGSSTATLAFSDDVADRVFFSPSSAVLGTRALAVIARQAAWIKARPEVSVIVEGHADDPGDVALNEAIAEQRAAAVSQRLIDAGVSASAIEVQGLGARTAIAPCDSAECAAQNRRVVTVVRNGQRTPARAASASQ